MPDDQEDTDDPNGFRLPEQTSFSVCGGSSTTITRERHITINRMYEHRSNGEDARISQLCEGSVFTSPPLLSADFCVMTRGDWETFKGEVDRAWVEFERRWPSAR